MYKKAIFFLLITFFARAARPQAQAPPFDSIQFNSQIELANWLIEYEFVTQLSADRYRSQPGDTALQWVSFKQDNKWHSVGGNTVQGTFHITTHVTADTLFNVSDYEGRYDTAQLNATAVALEQADTQFQAIRDTSSIYFSVFTHPNPDQSISIWYFPAFQPSGQAVYGCEWEFVFDKTGSSLLRLNSYTSNITGVWIGQPRELWLNYRNTDKPTLGSVFFALSYRDYFTRLRIDTRLCTSTLAKDKTGVYSWAHKMK